MNYHILVNKENKLDKFYVPEKLIRVDEPTGKKVDKNYKNYLEEETYKHFKMMQKAALLQGYEIFVDSSYRSYEYQEKVFKSSVLKNGLSHALKYCALPGASEHQTGLAIDIIYKKDNKINEKINELNSENK